MGVMIKPFEFAIERFWDGAPSPPHGYRATGLIVQSEKGLHVNVRARLPLGHRSPSAPTGTRLERLWEYDVVELFLVAEDRTYLEIELGAYGHWLILGFDDVRHRTHDYEDLNPEHTYTAVDSKWWESSILIPPDMIPDHPKRANAFAISDGEFYAWHPVPGKVPDFHQPETYPIL